MLQPYRMGFAIPTTTENNSLEYIGYTYDWIELNDNVQYANPSFAPAVTVPSNNLLGTHGPYEPVIQPIELDVLGDTPQRCWENLNKLIELLHEADRWYRGVPGNRLIRFFVQMTSTSPIVFSDILGFADQQAPQISEDFTNPLGPRYAINGVSIVFRRFGVWERNSRMQLRYFGPSQGYCYPAPEPVKVDFRDVNLGQIVGGTYPSQENVYTRFGVRQRGNYQMQSRAYIAIVTDPSKIKLVDSDDFNAGTIADDGTLPTNPYNGSFRRFSTGTGGTLTFPLGTFKPKNRVAIFAKIRNNSTTRKATLRLDTTNRYTNPGKQAMQVEIEPNTTGNALGAPRIVYVGTLERDYALTLSTSPYGASLPDIIVSADPFGGSDTIDIDYFMFVALDDPWADRILMLQPNDTYLPIGTSQPAEDNVIINPGVNLVAGAADIPKRSYPVLFQTPGNPDDPQTRLAATYQGNAHTVCKNDTFTYAFMAEFLDYDVTDGSVNATAWQAFFNSSFWLHLFQSPAYLVPPGE